MIGVHWRGWDGALWDLRRGPYAYLTDAGLAGLRNPAIDVFTRTSAVLDGQVVTGWKVKPRDVFLPIDVWHPAGEVEWYGIQTALDRTFRPDRPGTLTITDPLGNIHEISLRLGGDAGDDLASDPTTDAGLTTGYALVADDPWYLGPVVEHVFKDAAGPRRGFFPTPGNPGFYLAPGTFTGADTISNPGDVDAWPVWTLEGPLDEFRIEVGGRVLSSRLQIPAGATLTIDTRPQRKIASLREADGTATNVTPELELAQFARIPDGADVPVNVAIAGTGTALARFRPRYFRAWG